MSADNRTLWDMTSKTQEPVNPRVLEESAREWPSWDLRDRQLCDLEILFNGGFSPLSGFLTQADYELILTDMRLADGSLWPMPVTLDVTEEFTEGISVGDSIALRDPEGVMLAALHVEGMWHHRRATRCIGPMWS